MRLVQPKVIRIADRQSMATGPRTERFQRAEDAWFWTCAALRARQMGCGRGDRSTTARPCDPDDVIICLERLLQSKRLLMEHAEILGRWGVRGYRPGQERGDSDAAKLWTEALVILGAALAAKGIIARVSSKEYIP